jgi:hypothetical protein
MRLQDPQLKANDPKPAAPRLWDWLMVAILFFTGSGFATAASFSPPVALATNNPGGYKVSSALDASADAIAIWSGQYNYRAGATGAWSMAQSFGGTGSPTQAVHMTAAGDATAIWVANNTGVLYCGPAPCRDVECARATGDGHIGNLTLVRNGLQGRCGCRVPPTR